MAMKKYCGLACLAVMLLGFHASAESEKGDVKRATKKPAATAKKPAELSLMLQKADGYHGIWYCNQGQKDEYVFKYSGGLGTYCSSHTPFAVYCKAVNRTFFCYGASPKDKNTLLHAVSYYDHATGTVPRPTILLDKHTDDAHDNPVIAVDAKGYIWIFSSSHGTARPSCISVSKKPYDIDEFEMTLVTNFSYTQPHYVDGQGFLFLHTRYQNGRRQLYQMTSPDGRQWSEPVLYAAIQQGHYQTSWTNGKKVGTVFNFHPDRLGLNFRTNLYFMETDDFGRTWRTADGRKIEIPLATVANAALVHDYQAEKRNVYVQDTAFDAQGRPVLLYTTSGGWESGPKNDPRTWCTAWWNGRAWEISGTITSDNNYDMGSIYVEEENLWRIIGPTQDGPQRYNTGGEVAIWTSADHGKSWTMKKQLTRDSKYNHTYCRKPLNARPDFYALWADGHGREVSESRLYFTNRDGDHVWRLPVHMESDSAKPEIAW